MKRLSMAFAAALFLMACGDNSGTDTDTGAGSSIDSASTVPMTSPSDNTTDMHSDSTHSMDSIQNNAAGSQGSAPTPSGAGDGSSDAGGSSSSDNNQSR